MFNKFLIVAGTVLTVIFLAVLFNFAYGTPQCPAVCNDDNAEVKTLIRLLDNLNEERVTVQKLLGRALYENAQLKAGKHDSPAQQRTDSPRETRANPKMGSVVRYAAWAGSNAGRSTTAVRTESLGRTEHSASSSCPGGNCSRSTPTVVTYGLFFRRQVRPIGPQTPNVNDQLWSTPSWQPYRKPRIQTGPLPDGRSKYPRL